MKKGFRRTKQNFMNILTNPTYVGKIRIKADPSKDEPAMVVDGLHEPLIDEATFNRVQKILEERREQRKPTTKRDSDFYLRGHLVCSRCGANLTASFSGRKHKKFPYYHCLQCTERFRQEPAHQEIIEFLRSLKVKKEVIDGYLMLLDDIYQEKEVDRKQEISRIRQSSCE